MLLTFVHMPPGKYNLRTTKSFTSKMSEEIIIQKLEALDKKVDLKLTKLEGEFGALKSFIIDEIRNSFKEEFKKVEILESTVEMLQKQITTLKEQNDLRVKDTEELEQYGRRLCLRIDGIPCATDESSEKVFEKVEELIKESKCPIPSDVIDRAHRIGPVLIDRDSGRETKSIIVRFTTFRHRTMLYKSRKKIASKARVRLDLTKIRFKLLADARAYVEKNEKVNFVFADINCRPKVLFNDGTSNFFDDLEGLKKLLV